MSDSNQKDSAAPHRLAGNSPRWRNKRNLRNKPTGHNTQNTNINDELIGQRITKSSVRL